MRRTPILPAWPALPILLAACELTEVTVAPGDPRIIVQAVLSVGAAEQFVIVERSLTGAVSATVTHDQIPPGEPRIPITGASVTLAHEGPSACTPGVVTLAPRDAGSGVYATSAFCALEAGDAVLLTVVTPDNEVVRGRTIVPGARSVSVRLASDSAIAVGQLLELDRQRDTIRIAIDAVLARAMQVEARWRDDPDEIALYLFTDTLGIALPGNLFNPFEGDSGRPVFEVGQEYSLTVAVTDTNYYDFVRSRSDPFTGRGFLNHLEGGIGVFGSVEARTYYLRVVR
jgi:hypothetical protein